MTPRGEEVVVYAKRHSVKVAFDLAYYRPKYHVSGFSHPMVPVIAGDTVSLMRWGLIPGWARDPEKAKSIQNKTLNCIGEEAFEKASYKSAIVKNRGAVLVKGFYEWRDYQKKKYPYFIQGDDLLTLGCVFTNAADPDTGELIQTFSIVTTAASPMMAQIHNTKKRMPLVLNDWHQWISPIERPEIENFMHPSGVPLRAHTISNRLNHFQREDTNTPDITDPVTYPELPPI